ncbi:MAG TPA: winged helix-turn-helix transcriptional regulator [Candidatus Nanoarchaeia archaeon]|nr:winged helix-turn-helix transcriptional regulator [Candidatus Nanoarchaeia archaeon]
MIKERLNLDERDLQILAWHMEDPQIPQQEIASRLKLSQPSVNVRIQKLKEKGILSQYAGVNLNRTGLILVRVDFVAKDAAAVLEKMKGCPFFVNGFVMSGEKNASAYLINDSLKKIDEIINHHLRADGSVSSIVSNVVVSAVKDHIVTMDMSAELRQAGCISEGKCSSAGLCNKCVE